MALAGDEEHANTCFVKHGACWHIACWHYSAFRRGNLHFLTPLKTGQRLGELLMQGRFLAGAKLQYIEGRFDNAIPRQSFPMVALQHAAASGGEERLQMNSVLLENMVIMGLVCPWLCVSGKSTRTEHPVWEPGSIVCRLAGRLVRAGAHLSLFPEQVSQSSFVAGSMSLWQDCFSGSGGVPACPGLSALQPKGQLLKRISQTTHLRLASLRLGAISHCRHKPEVTNYFQCV